MKHIGRVEIIEDAFDLMKCLCVCPHCGRKVYYGQLMKVSGINCCPACNEALHYEIESDKKRDYKVYEKKANNYEYEPHRYKGED